MEQTDSFLSNEAGTCPSRTLNLCPVCSAHDTHTHTHTHTHVHRNMHTCELALSTAAARARPD